MPKAKSSVSSRLHSYVNKYGNNNFSSDGEVLFCKVRNIKVSALKRFTLEQHISREKHTRGVKRQKESEKPKTQLLLTDTSITSKKSSFNLELCQTLLLANIPLNKLNNEHFRKFLEKNIKVDIPNESTLRKNYVELCYNDTMQKIRDYVGNKKIWVSMDETTDVEGRYVVNVIIGTWELENARKIFLLHTDVLEKANNSTIAKIAAEEIRTNFQDINKLISSVKKVFLKAPYRVQIFKTIVPGIPLPPVPVLTRWGTWINAGNYYCEHLSDIKKVILELDKNDSVAIKDVIEQVLNPSLETNLIYLKSNFGFIPSEITQLKTSGILLSESIKCIKKIESLIQKAPNKIGQTIATKMENVILKNNGFKIVTNISEMLDGKGVRGEDIPEDLTTDDITYFKLIAKEYEAKWNFPNCVSAMDGKHIAVQAPEWSGTEHYNYKQFFSIVLFAIVDANYNFIYADVECQGRISDGGVFSNTSFNKSIETCTLNLPPDVSLPGRTVKSPYVFVGDDAFPLLRNILKPYPGIQEKGSANRVFNYRLSRARRTLENVFGILSSVFRVFRKPLLLDPEKATNVTLAAIYLNNYLRNSHSKKIYCPPGTLDLECSDTRVTKPGAWRTDNSGQTSFNNFPRVARKSSLDATEVRNEFREYFLTNEERVSWQYDNS
ncbi:hypothetical protein QTP88_016713 [Uroleucon formosanum]